MSVDEIIQNAMMRRQRDKQQASPPTRDLADHQSREESGQKTLRNYQVSPFHPPPAQRNEMMQRTPPPIYTSYENLHNEQSLSKSYEEQQDNNENAFFERKVEDILRKIIGTSQMSSIQGSRESSIPRNNGNENFYNFNPQLSNQNPMLAGYNSLQNYGFQNVGYNVPPNYSVSPQSNFMSNDDLVKMRKRIDDLQMTLTEKDAEIIWLQMKLGDEKHHASRVTLHRDVSRPSLNQDASHGSLLENTPNGYSKYDDMKKDKDKLEKRVKELELAKIKLENENDKLTSERDNLKLKIGFLEANTQNPALHNNSMNVDIMLDNKATKQKLLESKEDYGKLLKEQIAEKEKWDKEKEIFQSTINKQDKIISDYKQAVSKHQEDVKKAIKIHKANEKLAQQNVALKKDLEQYQSGNFPQQNSDSLQKSVSFQNDTRNFDTAQSQSKLGAQCGNTMCLKTLTEKQNLENELEIMNDKMDELVKQLNEERNKKQQPQTVIVEDSKGLQELEDRLQQSQSKLTIPNFTFHSNYDKG